MTTAPDPSPPSTLTAEPQKSLPPPPRLLITLPVITSARRDAVLAEIHTLATDQPEILDLRLALTERFIAENQLKYTLFAAAARVRGVETARLLGTTAERLWQARLAGVAHASATLSAIGYERRWAPKPPWPTDEDIIHLIPDGLTSDRLSLTIDRDRVRDRAREAAHRANIQPDPSHPPTDPCPPSGAVEAGG